MNEINDLSEQQAIGAQTAITALLLVIGSFCLIIAVVAPVYLLSFGQRFDWQYFFIPSLIFFMIVILIKDVRKGERLETIKALFKKTFIPGLMVSILSMTMLHAFLFNQYKSDIRQTDIKNQHEHELKLAYLKGQHDAVIERNETCLRSATPPVN